MNIVKRITIDDKERYVSSQIVESSPINESEMFLLEKAIKNFTADEFGKEAANKIKIMQINDFNQINEPLIDCLLAYKLANEHGRVHVYQRKTNVITLKNWTWGTSDKVIPEFRKTHIFEIEQYNYAQPMTEFQNEVRTITSPPKNQIISLPRGFDLVEQLKNSPKFKARINNDDMISFSPNDQQEVAEPVKPVITMEENDNTDKMSTSDIIKLIDLTIQDIEESREAPVMKEEDIFEDTNNVKINPLYKYESDKEIELVEAPKQSVSNVIIGNGYAEFYQ